jgi:hypothetical protein
MAWTAASLFPQFNQVALSPRLTTPVREATQPRSTQPAPTTRPTATQTRQQLRSQTLNDPSLMGTGRLPTPAGATQVGSSIPVTGPSAIPSFLNNPAGILGNALFPYSDLLSQIMQPAGSALPPEVAAAYSNAANAAAARTQAQTQAIQASLSLPGQAANLNQRLSSMAPFSLAGLPTGLGYQDPTQALRNQIFQTNTAMLPTSGVNQLARTSAGGSGWFPSLPMV